MLFLHYHQTLQTLWYAFRIQQITIKLVIKLVCLVLKFAVSRLLFATEHFSKHLTNKVNLFTCSQTLVLLKVDPYAMNGAKGPPAFLES